MKNLSTYIIEKNIQNDWNSLVLEEYSISMGEQMINESFKSSLLQKLANTIIKYQKGFIEMKKEYEARGGRLGDPQSFTSIFGPTSISKGRYVSHKQRIRGVKWNEIDDSQFKTYNGWDKSFAKIMKEVYSHKKDALILVCYPDTDDIIYVIRAIDLAEKVNPSVWQFKDDPNNSNPRNKQTFKKVETPIRQGAFTTGAPRYNTIMEMINNFVIHFLEITSDIKQDYTVLTGEREKNRSGMVQSTVGYTKEQLKALSQQANNKLKALAKAAKAKKLMSGKLDFMDRINDINKRVMELYHKCISSEKFLTENYSIGSLMSYMSDVYDNYYGLLRAQSELNGVRDRYRKERQLEGDELEQHVANSFYFGNLKSSLSNLESSISRIEEEIDRVNKRMNGEYD